MRVAAVDASAGMTFAEALAEARRQRPRPPLPALPAPPTSSTAAAQPPPALTLAAPPPPALALAAPLPPSQQPVLVERLPPPLPPAPPQQPQPQLVQPQQQQYHHHLHQPVPMPPYPMTTLQEKFLAYVMCDFTPRHPRELPIVKWASFNRLLQLFQPHAPIGGVAFGAQQPQAAHHSLVQEAPGFPRPQARRVGQAASKQGAPRHQVLLRVHSTHG